MYIIHLKGFRHMDWNSVWTLNNLAIYWSWSQLKILRFRSTVSASHKLPTFKKTPVFSKTTYSKKEDVPVIHILIPYKVFRTTRLLNFQGFCSQTRQVAQRLALIMGPPQVRNRFAERDIREGQKIFDSAASNSHGSSFK